MTSYNIARNSDTHHDTLSSGKKGTSGLMIRIQNELRKSKIGDICTYNASPDIAPAFQNWKMKFHREADMLLALAAKSDREAIFFRIYLSKDTLESLNNFKSRLLDSVS